MSLYNNIAASLSSQGLVGSIRTGLNSAAGGVASAAAQAMGGGVLAQTVASIGKNMAVNAGMGLVNKYVPAKAQRALSVGSGAVGDLMRGDWNSAGMRLLDSGLLNKYLPGFGGGVAAQASYWGTPTPLFGGISPAEAKRICDELSETKFSKKNLWLIEVSSKLKGDASHRFNLFATDIEYGPYTLTGEKRHVGTTVIDSVQGTEHTDIRLTTLDDQTGTIKRWFADHFGAAAAADGTVGVPRDYAIKIKVVHAFITRGSNQGGYEDIGLYRPASLDISLSRREDGLQEVQMNFSQLDTFMAP